MRAGKDRAGMNMVGGVFCAVVVAVSVVTGACSSDNNNDKSSTASTATSIAPTQTSAPVGPNTTVTVARPTTTGQ